MLVTPKISQYSIASLHRTAILSCNVLRNIALSFFIALTLTACGGNNETPEERLQAWLTEFEVAVKDKKLSEIKAHISSDYEDVRGNTRQHIMLKLALLFKQYKDIGLRSSVVELDATPETARMVVDIQFSQSQAFATMGLSRNRYQFILLFEADGDDWLLNNVTYSEITQH